MEEKHRKDAKLYKYLKYAVGEIILVVVGILIALGLGEYNNNLKIDKRTQVYLESLNDEFRNNLEVLEFTISKNQSNIVAAKRILDVIEEKSSYNDESELALMIGNSLGYSPSFLPESSILFEMISSGAIKDINNMELRKHLASWSRKIDNLRFQENLLHKNQGEAFSLVREKGSLRSVLNEVGVTENLMEIEKIVPNNTNLPLLKSDRFENEILLFITTSIILESSQYEPIKKEIKLILDLLEQEIS